MIWLIKSLINNKKHAFLVPLASLSSLEYQSIAI